MNIAIVDDLEPDRLRLEKYLRKYDAAHGLNFRITQFDSGEALLRDFVPFRYSLIFLDIYMDGMTGVDAAKKIRETDENVLILFLTTSREYSMEAFSVFASGYLEKPCEEAALFRTLNHVLCIKSEQEKTLTFSYAKKNYCLRLSDVVLLETKGNYIVITDREDQTYRTRKTFSEASSLLDRRFLTLVKGVSVNMDYITEIKGRNCYLENGMVLFLHVRKQKELFDTWMNYKFAKLRESAAQGGNG